MKKQILGYSILALLVIAGLGFYTNSLDLGLFKFFGPKREAVKREIFEQSKEYQHGTIQELDKMRLEYIRTKDLDVKGAIASRALRMTAEFDKSNLPPDIRFWLEEINK